LFRFR